MRYEIDGETGCWNWLGSLTRGYGYAVVGDKEGPVHRAAYQLFVGEILPRHHIHHLCENKRCFNPEHLESVAPDAHRKLHFSPLGECKWGHPFDEANTYVTRKGDRQCRACKARRERDRQRRLRAQATA